MQKSIWIHACSLGEVKSIEPLIQNINDEANLSTITNTGFLEAQKYSSNTRYLPFEIFLPFWIKKQDILIVTEAELWLMLFVCAKKKGAKTILINARISDKSYKKYSKFSFVYKIIFKHIDYVFCQTQIDKQRLQTLGAQNIKIAGHTKLLSIPKVTRQYDKSNQNTKNFKETITAASTHKGEEELILKAFSGIRDKRLIIVPRHKERFEDIKKMLQYFAKKAEYTFSALSEDKSLNSDIVLIDTIGELINIYAISDLVILCGSFSSIGGHNPLEPAFFGCKIITGEHIFNQKFLFSLIDGYKIIKKEQLKSYMSNSKNIQKSKIINMHEAKNMLNDIKKLIGTKNINDARSL